MNCKLCEGIRFTVELIEFLQSFDDRGEIRVENFQSA